MIRIADARDALRLIVKQEAERWAKNDPFISKDDIETGKAQKYWRDRYGWYNDAIREAADEIRAEKGKGAKVGVRETVDRVMQKADLLWSQFNEATGRGRVFLAKEEAGQVEKSHPPMGALTLQAYEMARRNEALGHPEKVNNLGEYEKLPRDTRQRVVELNDWAFANYRSTGEMELSELRDEKAVLFAQKMDAFMRSNAAFDIEGDYHATVGDPQILVEVIFLPSGEIAGGTIRYYQEGADMPDGSSPHFDSEEEALAAGAEFSDVNWQMSAEFDHDLSTFRADEYFEWSGY